MRRSRLRLERAVPRIGTAILLTFACLSTAQARPLGDIVFEKHAAQETPAAVFPHWFHRIRFRCFVCHPAIFPMQKTSGREIQMDDIRAGRYCGACHDGKTAWAPSYENCTRCHLDE